MILKAEPLDPSFKWHGHKPERSRWWSIGLLLAIAMGAGFYVGRLSTAAPILSDLRTPEQQAASTSVVHSQSAPQSDAATAVLSSKISVDTKPAAKDEIKPNEAASSTETPKAQSAAATEKGASRPPVVLINPSTADKGVAGEATKAVSKIETEAPAKATAKTETRKFVDDAAPAVTKRQARSSSPAHSNIAAAPIRQESAAVRREDAHVAPRRDDAYVPPRAPQTAFPDQRERYDSAERDDDRARLEQPYADRRYPEPDRRFAEDVPPPRDVYEERRGYLRPFQGAREFREYRRFGGYDDDTYADRRPVLRPMYGGPGY
jgi:hypothetical protein